MIFLIKYHFLFYFILSSIHHGQRHRLYLQTWSIPILNSTNQETSFSSSASQTSSSIELTITCVSYITDKEQTDTVFCSQNTIQNDLNITNNDNINSCETPRKQNYSIPTTSTPKHHAQSIGAMPVRPFNLHTTVKLPPLGK